MELQRGRTIALKDASEHRLVQLLETSSARTFEQHLHNGNCMLVITRVRGKALGLLSDSDHICIKLPENSCLQQVRRVAGLENFEQERLVDDPLAGLSNSGLGENSINKPAVASSTAGKHAAFAQAALKLAHHAHVLPALLMSDGTLAAEHLSADISHVSAYTDRSGELTCLARAGIPLAGAEHAELVVFREKHGSAEHAAIIVGKPDLQNKVTVRLHSSCFTGDILGSLRCDCGEQLNGALESMAQHGGGVILYVSQEGRGIGLASKLLAYQLQDAGLDTIEANQHLGFDADERSYSAASTMLRKLGITRLRLMTNNPTKISALREAGFDVVERLPSPATINVHNARYLETKRQKAGHLAVVE